MSVRAIGILAAALFVLGAPAAPQESDFEVKQQFDGRVQSLRTAVDQAASVTALDSLAVSIGELESGYRSRSAFLDKALYPETFASTIDGLTAMHAVAYDRVSTIQMQGARILDLETRLAVMVGGIDSLRRERDRLYAELRDSREQLRALSQRLVEVQENERRAIARELHDEAAQVLTAMSMDVHLLLQHPDTTPALAEKLRIHQQALQDVKLEMHRVVVTLHPTGLDRAGLVPALEQYVQTQRIW